MRTAPRRVPNHTRNLPAPHGARASGPIVGSNRRPFHPSRSRQPHSSSRLPWPGPAATHHLSSLTRPSTPASWECSREDHPTVPRIHRELTPSPCRFVARHHHVSYPSRLRAWVRPSASEAAMSSHVSATSEPGDSAPESRPSTDVDTYGCVCAQPGGRCCRDGCPACGDGRAHRDVCWDLFPDSKDGPFHDADCCACGNSDSCRSMRCEHSCCLAPRRWRHLVRAVLRSPSLRRHLAFCNSSCDWYPCFFLFPPYCNVAPAKLLALDLPLPKRRRLGHIVHVD